MARKLASPVSEGSQKENSNVYAREEAATDKKNAKSARRAARIESDEEDEPEFNAAGEGDEEEQEEEDEGQEDDEGSPKGRKRARANTIGDSRPSQPDIKGKGKAKTEPKTLPRDDDGFIPGSIVRVQLRNFVTYDYVEFTPGPYLNMILGPNGTGKSSIACAICLGLNFPPSVLGRASEINSFVKIGTEEGHIEIELKGANGQPNLVIKRTLSARSKANQFYMNGKHASGKEVAGRMQELNVQVSNLCSFLPQDKVAEFARMSPQQLLRETQRAAGNASLTSWHDTLIETGKDFKNMKEHVDADQAQLANMEERNANLERDVKKYEERQKIEREIEFLELLLPFKEYSEAKDKYEGAKARQRKAHEKLKTIQAKNAPIIEFKDKLQAEQDAADNRRTRMKDGMKEKFKQMKRKWEESEQLESSAEDLKNKLDNLKKAEKSRQRRIDNLRKEIIGIQKQIENPPEFEDVDALLAEMNGAKAQGRAIQSQLDEIQARQREFIDDQSKYKREVDVCHNRLKQLDNADVQKLESLTRWHRDTGDVVKWLRQNQDRFRHPILEPPMLSINVRDRRFVHAIEACFGANDMQTFVAQCDEDYRLLNQLVADTPDALGRKARINSWYRDPTHVAPPPLSPEDLVQLGFDGYALDYVTYPEGMKFFLQSTLNLHRTAIALDPRKVDSARAMETLSKDGSISYIVGNVLNQVRRSRYGKRLAQNSTREIGKARNLENATVDQSVKQTLERALNEHMTHVKEYDTKIAECAQEEGQARKEFSALKRTITELQGRKQAADRVRADFEGLSLRIRAKERELRQAESEPSAEDARQGLRQKIMNLTKRRVAIVQEYMILIRAVIAEQTEMTRLALQFLQISANKNKAEQICQKRLEAQQKASEAYTKVNEEYHLAKNDATSKLRVGKEKLDSVDNETRSRFTEMEESGQKDERSADEVHAELETLKHQLDMNTQTNAGVVDQFRKRQAEIAALKETIEDRESKLNKVEMRIKRTRELWEPALRTLVDSIGEKFSAAFDRIGCAGEIKIAEHDDYDKWAIDILVKFRDDEKLQLLTAERQSGGERSLTTILYLMSLTELARAPFSLVDEINQGMDARAERAVHNSLVDVTCKPDSGQYFLITPKLLPDLRYHERMKILCVNNGEWLLPDEGTSGNLMSMIDCFVSQQAGQA
ncbi:hypothetical protein PHLGIDRAFT_101267 [Phlebiopsis gigantea 11061_1 CR5-6]|uniref:Structural maintenance of chromosomes protein 5 n=1 Tax=Phlebiopsis gigantea (strain 11061_1 CR5-6) TaxID=745531 RepID=A0A0C3SEC1_PHLG1|nr:hypothetical protein PHLGIDRAFT_101267 [Phlebiopsis gigantea 11061_1 CR5-6]